MTFSFPFSTLFFIFIIILYKENGINRRKKKKNRRKKKQLSCYSNLANEIFMTVINDKTLLIEYCSLHNLSYLQPRNFI